MNNCPCLIGGDYVTFVINGIEWNVYKVPAYSYMLRRSDNSLTVGMCDFSKCSIFLCDKLKGPFLRKVFLHEVCHSAIFSYDIEMDIQQEEFLCDFISTYGDEIFRIVDDMFAALKKAYIS